MSRKYKILFLSDTHIFYPNSRLRDGFAQETIEAFGAYNYVILGGDTWDLQYSFYRSVIKFMAKNPGERLIEKDMKGEEKLHPLLKEALRQASYDARDQMLGVSQKFNEMGAATEVLNLIGNHDNITRLIHELDILEQTTTNFKSRQEFYKIGTALFTHGDTVLRRQESLEHRETVKPRNYVIDMIDNEMERQLHNVMQMTWFLFWNQEALVVPRFASRLAEQKSLKPMLADVTDVFSGHVHVTPYYNHMHKGIRYHQPGASIKHRNCRPLEIIMQSDIVTPEFLGEGRNILLPDAKVVSVKPVRIPGLSHEFKWTELFDRKAAAMNLKPLAR